MDAVLDVLSNAADGVFVIDQNQRIVLWNGAAERMLGFIAEEVMGRPCHEIVQGRDDYDHPWCRANCHIMAVSRAGDPVETFNTLTNTKSGDLRWLNISVLTLPAAKEGEASLVVHLFRDATEIKQQVGFARQILGVVGRFKQAEVASGPAGAAGLLADKLTDREIEVLTLLAQGLSTEKIAETLSVSRATTRNHIQNILQKLRVHSRAEAVAYAFEHGMVA
jgi:PAS domain S-box-containing protein